MKKSIFIAISILLSNYSFSEEWDSIPVKNNINLYNIEMLDFANCGLVDDNDDDEYTCEELTELINEEEKKPNTVIAACKADILGQGYYCKTSVSDKLPLADVLRQVGMKKANFAVAIECLQIKRYDACTWAIFGEK